MVFDGAHADVERDGELAAGLASGGQRGDAAFAGGQRLRAGEPRPARSRACGQQLLLRARPASRLRRTPARRGSPAGTARGSPGTPPAPADHLHAVATANRHFPDQTSLA